MVIDITEQQIHEALAVLGPAVDTYCWIQDRFTSSNVIADAEFQQKFNGYYRVRRNAEWRRAYYCMMESARQSQPTFSTVLGELNQRTRRIEASFTSKLIATVNPLLPVIDRFVLERLEIKLPYYKNVHRIEGTVKVYEDVCKKYEQILSSAPGSQVCAMFDARFPRRHLTAVKKIDLVLWKVRA
jgi:hypothetical protein